MPDITKQSLTELVENIKNKKLSSTDVTKAFIDRSETVSYTHLTLPTNREV